MPVLFDDPAGRISQRIEVFDGNGKYETKWHSLMRPCGLFVSPRKAPLVIIGELGPETAATLTAGWEILIKSGRSSTYGAAPPRPTLRVPVWGISTERPWRSSAARQFGWC